jgi:hypothetical protein
MKIALGWIYWIFYQLLSGVVSLLGLVVIAPLAYFKCWEWVEGRNPLFPNRKVLSWKWRYVTLPWCNDESGIDGFNLVPGRLSSYRWCALQNSANNLRLLPLASFKFEEPPTVKHYGPFVVMTYGWRQCIQLGDRRIGWLMHTDFGRGWRSWPVIQ